MANAEVIQVDILPGAGAVGAVGAVGARPAADEPAPPMPAVVSGLPSGLFFLAIGAVLGLIGWLAAAAADGRGMASGISIGLLWVSGVLTSIGVIAIGVKIGVEDARAR